MIWALLGGTEKKHRKSYPVQLVFQVTIWTLDLNMKHLPVTFTYIHTTYIHTIPYIHTFLYIQYHTITFHYIT